MKRTSLFYVLLVMVIGIWGYIAYALARGVAPPAPYSPMPALEEVPAYDERDEVFVYDGTFRDPFDRAAPRIATASAPPTPTATTSSDSRASASQATEESAPHMTLGGIIGETALVEYGMMHVVREGEDVDGWVLTALTDTTARLQMGSKTLLLTLQNQEP